MSVGTQEKEKKAPRPTDVVTPEFRASYPNLFEARSADPKKPNDKNYGVEMIFRVAETEESKKAGEKVVSIEPLKAAAFAACSEAWGPDKAKWPRGYKHPFQDGNGDKWRDTPGKGPGTVFIRANRKESFGRPGVVDQNVKDVLDKTLIYGGMYARAKLHAYVWKHPTGGDGVSFTLDHFQIIRDGEPFGSATRPEDDFDPIPLPAGAGAEPAKAAASDDGMFGELG